MHKNSKYGFDSKILFQLFFLLLVPPVMNAQVIDTLKTTGPKDTVILKKTVIYHSPKQAALYSTMLPGLGQAYNKKYWKIPVLYACIGGITYSIIYNNNNYLTYRTAYRIRKDNDPSTVDEFADITSKNYLNDDNLLSLTKGYHRWRDLSIFGAALLYVLNIVDASVDAHLFLFDVSDNLSVNVQPVFITTAGINKPTVNMTGLSIHFNF